MTGRFAHSLAVVALAHAGIVLTIVLVPGCRALFVRTPEVAVPVDFVVEAPPPAAEAAVPPEPAPDEPREEPPDEPVVPDPRPEPRKRKPIKVSRRKVRRAVAEPARPPKALSREEVRKLLAQGAKLGDHTSIPDEDARGFEAVRQALYQVWDQPAAEEAAGAVAEVSIRLAADGAVTERTLSRASGLPALDASVMRAVKAVDRIHGLTASFLRRHKVVTVSFKVEESP
jgi:TonB family protein